MLELLVTMGIMVMIMSIAFSSYMGIRRGAEIRGAVIALRTTLMLARQEAVTKRKTVTIEFIRGVSNSVPDTMNVLFSSMSVITTNSIIPIPLGVQYDDASTLPPPIIFKPSGRAMGTGKQSIKLVEKQGVVTGVRGSRTITVWFLTGVTKEE